MLWTILATLTEALTIALALAQTPNNGDFEAAASPPTGWTAHGNVTVQPDATGNHRAVFREENSNGLSRIYQTIDIPDAATALVFQYQFLTAAAAGPATVPPDSFSAFLVDSAGQRLIGNEPAITEAFLYQVSTGDGVPQLLYDPSVVTIYLPGPDGLAWVMLNISALPDTPNARLEFGFATGKNNANSLLVIDNVALDCPPAYCCDLLTGTFTPLDDGLICTIDTCGAGGSADHEPIPCCGECNEVSANIVIMIDRTSSIAEDDLVAEKQAAKQLLDRFAVASPRPKIAIGTFNGPCSGCTTNARMEGGGQLTDDYGADGLPGTGLYAIINAIQIPASQSYTDLEAAISVAQGELSGLDDAPNYIVIISDGMPNHPYNDCDSADPICHCASADAAAIAAAGAAETAGTDIIAIHFEGTAIDCSEFNEPTAGKDFLKYQIATDEDLFIDGNIGGGLACAFVLVADLIACDDGDSSTVDECILGVCHHTGR
jgi:hypothetical protein